MPELSDAELSKISKNFVSNLTFQVLIKDAQFGAGKNDASTTEADVTSSGALRGKLGEDNANGLGIQISLCLSFTFCRTMSIATQTDIFYPDFIFPQLTLVCVFSGLLRLFVMLS